MSRWRTALVAMVSSLTVAACDLLVPVEPVLTPQARPSTLSVGVPQATSEESAKLRQYLREVQSSQLTQGLLRQDGGGTDTPYTPDRLAANFEKIAFFNEYGTPNTPVGVSGGLRRWSKPIRMRLVFGPSVPPSQKAQDRKDVAQYIARLSRVTGHPISLVEAGANFQVFFVSEDDRAATIDRVAPRLPGVNRTNLTPVRNLQDDVYCAVAAYATGRDPSTYTAAVAVIRAENPDLLRLSCIHEELAQGMGLANDSPNVRPSIFNDDDEFALLTTHDEYLLTMLYDPRLRPGMTLPQARPITRILARELLLGPL